jgi:hypothetical protein
MHLHIFSRLLGLLFRSLLGTAADPALVAGGFVSGIFVLIAFELEVGCFIIYLSVLIRSLLDAPRFQIVFAVLAAFAGTQVGAAHSTLVALTILLEAATFLAMAALRMVAFFLDLRLESVGVSVDYRLHGLLPFFVSFRIGTVIAVAIWTAPQAKCKAVAVQL